jgi:hypothetical protein
MCLPSSESGGGVPVKEAQKPICHWCFKPIDGKPVFLSYDLDLPTLRFHDKDEADKFQLALMLGEDGPLWKAYAKRMAAYDKKVKAAEARELKRLARRSSGAKVKSKTA